MFKPIMINDEIRRRIRGNRALLEHALIEAGATIAGDNARCPFHNDQRPSGSIHRMHDGSDSVWLFTCHACEWHETASFVSGTALPHRGGRIAKPTGDAIAVVQRAKRLDFIDAVQHLLELAEQHGAAVSPISIVIPQSSDSGPDPAELQRAQADARAAHARLMEGPSWVDLLWTTRAIDRTTAERFGLGVIGEGERAYWTFPVTDNGTFVALKGHAVNGQSPKSWWSPKGVGSKRVWPVSLDPPGYVILAPGELKALGVISMGRPAVAMTCGESCELPAAVIEALQGREVAIAPDADDIGRDWAQRALRQLSTAGINAVVLDLGLEKGQDLGDFIVEHGAVEGNPQ